APGRECDDVDEPRALVAGVVPERKLEDPDVAQELAVAAGGERAAGEGLVELLELGAAAPGSPVRPSLVEPPSGGGEPATRVGTTLVPKAPQEFPFLLRVRRHHPALAGGDLLVRIEREDGGRTV